MKDRGGISQKGEDEKHSPDIASIRRHLLAFHSKRPVAAAVVLKVKHLIHVAPKLLSFYEWLKSILYFCILCSVVFLTWLSGLKHLVAHVAPTLRCFRHLSPSYEWLVKVDSKMCKTQRLKSFGRLSILCQL